MTDMVAKRPRSPIPYVQKLATLATLTSSPQRWPSTHTAGTILSPATPPIFFPLATVGSTPEARHALSRFADPLRRTRLDRGECRRLARLARDRPGPDHREEPAAHLGRQGQY